MEKTEELAPTPKELSKHDRYARTFAGRYRRLKHAADKRGLAFDITLDGYVELIAKAVCTYCNGSLGAVGYGLDRMDNSKGYVMGNVIPCCGTCNEIKGANLTHAEALAAIGAVHGLRKAAALGNE